MSLQGNATMCGVVDDSTKSCSMCGIKKTPLWRSGPAGPKSLCNACGIKHRKRNIFKSETFSKSETKLEKLSSLKSKPKLGKSSSTNLQQPVKVGLAAFGKDMWLLQGQGSLKRRRSEEEEVAILLMSLSCGSIFA